MWVLAGGVVSCEHGGLQASASVAGAWPPAGMIALLAGYIVCLPGRGTAAEWIELSTA